MWYLNDFAKPDVNYPEYCSNPSGVYLLSRATVCSMNYLCKNRIESIQLS